MVRSGIFPHGKDERRQTMRTPDEVAAMQHLHSWGWGTRRIASEVGCNRETVQRYLAAGVWMRRQTTRAGAGMLAAGRWHLIASTHLFCSKINAVSASEGLNATEPLRPRPADTRPRNLAAAADDLRSEQGGMRTEDQLHASFGQSSRTGSHNFSIRSRNLCLCHQASPIDRCSSEAVVAEYSTTSPTVEKSRRSSCPSGAGRRCGVADDVLG